MFEVDAPSSLRALEKLHQPVVRQRLDEIAARITSASACTGAAPPIDADALVDHALARVFDPELDPWDGGRLDFVRHVSVVMLKVWIGWRPGHARLARELREALADDPFALRCFDALAGGIRPEAMAALFGCSEREVSNARRRFLFQATFIQERENTKGVAAPPSPAPERSKEDPR